MSSYDYRHARIARADDLNDPTYRALLQKYMSRGTTHLTVDDWVKLCDYIGWRVDKGPGGMTISSPDRRESETFKNPTATAIHKALLRSRQFVDRLHHRLDEFRKQLEVESKQPKVPDDIRSIIDELNKFLKSQKGDDVETAQYDERYNFIAGAFRSVGLPYGGDPGFTESKLREAERRISHDTRVLAERRLGAYPSVASIEVTVGDKEWVYVQVNLKR